MPEYYNAFISYGRPDSKSFATKLWQKLTENGLKIWIDQNDIPLGVDFQNQIDDGITKADNFLFIISPHAVNSPYCLKEINHAIKYNKRIIPLLHVEQISYEIWQQRNSEGTVEKWEIYQQKGLDSYLTNMHPEIRRINWVYFRENIDDFERSFTGLIELLDRHKNYVKQHTNFLVKSLEWVQNQKQTGYLLFAQERQQAAEWLKTKFIDEQPPCIPTDLHCEFICESEKNANNLMTQVFLSFAEADKSMMEKIKKSLIREGITVWTYHTDIKTGKDFQTEINQGIAGADNLVYLLSPESIKSEYCQQELIHAFSLNKRIIYLLTSHIDLTKMAPVIRNLQYIYLNAESYQEAVNRLIKELQEDAVYYHQNKVLLVKALKWQEQNRNPSILLRGYNLEKYQIWLETVQCRTANLPTDLQVEFITESAKQPPNLTVDVFISYSSTDSDFARRLNDTLLIQGKTTWFDQESIATGTDFQKEIYRGIEQSDNFLFIISPESINSPFCDDEVEYAKSLNKRFVTVLHRKVNSADIHQELAKVQWLDFEQYGGDFYANFSELLRTLDTDRDHIRRHTKCSQRALEWQENNRVPDLLLRGCEFAVVEAWVKIAETENKKPTLTNLQKEFITESQKAIEAAKQKEEEARQREFKLVQERLEQEKIARENERKARKATQKTFGVTVLLAIAVSDVFAIFQWRNAEISQIQALRQSTELNRRSNQHIEALLDVLRIAKLVNGKLLQLFQPHEELEELIRTLPKVVYTVEELNRLEEHNGRVMNVDFQSTPNGEMIVTQDSQGIALWNLDGKLDKKYTYDQVNTILQNSDGDLYQTLKQNNLLSVFTVSPNGNMFATRGKEEGTIELWNSDGTLHKSFPAHNRGMAIMTIKFSPDSQMIATGSWENEAKLWKLDGTLYKTLQGHSGAVNTLDFSSDGEMIASGSNDGTVKLWNQDGTLIKTLEGHRDVVWGVSISPDNQTIASGSNDGTVKLWNRDGTLMKTLEGHYDVVRAVRFSSDGNILASASDDGTVKLWWLGGTPLTILNHDNDKVYTVSFSPDGGTIATTRGHGYVTFWREDGMRLETLQRHYGPISIFKFSPDGELILSAAGDRAVKLSTVDGSESKFLEGHTGKLRQKQILAASFSPESEIFAIGDLAGKIEIWKRDGTLLKTIEEHQGKIWGLSFSPDGEIFASASDDGTVKLWNRNGSSKQTLSSYDSPFFGVAFSPDEDPDNQIIAGAIGDGTVKLWNRDGIELKTFQAHQDLVSAIVFSPNGQLIATASYDKTVKLWNRDGTLYKTFYGHNDHVIRLAFSPDGNRIASASKDKTVLLWNLDLELDMYSLSQYTCDWMRDYLKHNPNVDESYKELCEIISIPE